LDSFNKSSRRSLKITKNHYAKEDSGMNKIICPSCQTQFTIDENSYAEILQQVRNEDFQRQLREISVIEASKKAGEIELVRVKSEAQITGLKAEIKNAQIAQQLAISEATRDLEKQRDEANAALERVKLEAELTMKGIKSNYESLVREKDEAILHLRDMKLKLSTKMLGETLEQHCENMFNQIRATAFQNSIFEKDNDSRTGSKGDYIFRDFTETGLEYISIMFEMKNESDTTVSKSKNEDFLRELDKDRQEKKCEYAVLVSLLEAESDLYNSGIVDVSHRFPKMYVVRPQFFIPIITLLRNAAQNTIEFRDKLRTIEAQTIDVRNFEDKLNQFKAQFGRDYDLASKHFQKAIDEIEKSIDHLQKTKDQLHSTIRSLRLANDKAQDVSIKKLTRDNPTMEKKFNELGGA
jgi:hypothetical protein